MRRLLAVAVLCAFAGVLPADPPKITGADKWEPNRLVTLAVTGVAADDGVMWKVRPLDPANEGKVEFTDGGRSGARVQWVAPPGRYRAEVIVVRPGDAKRFALDGDEKVITIGAGDGGDVAPKPKPDPDPVPTPKPDPADGADPALVAKLKPLIAEADRASAAALGKVYYTTGVLLANLNDPAAAPRTFRDVLTNLLNASDLAGVPRLPALAKLRTAVAAELGTYDAMAPFTPALKAELVAKYKRMGASLQAAAK